MTSATDSVMTGVQEMQRLASHPMLSMRTWLKPMLLTVCPVLVFVEMLMWKTNFFARDGPANATFMKETEPATAIVTCCAVTLFPFPFVSLAILTLMELIRAINIFVKPDRTVVSLT
jgi:hypothetical protein